MHGPLQAMLDITVFSLVSTFAYFLCMLIFRYARLDSCLTPLPVDGMGNLQSWPKPWPQRLTSKPPSLPTDSDAKDKFFKDSKRWSELVSDFYMNGLSIKWSSVRNVMDMNAGYAG